MSRANPRFRRINPALPVPTNNLYRFRLYGSIENQLTISTFYYLDNQSVGVNYIGSAIISTFRSQVAVPYRAAVSADWTLTKVTMDSPNNPNVIPYQDTTQFPGTGPAGHMPTEVAATFVRYTNTKGQSGRGRFSLPAVPLIWVTNSIVSAAAGITAYNAVATSIQPTGTLTLGASVLTPALMSRPPRTKILGAAILTTTTFNPLLGTIRRRKIGRGK